MCTPSRTSYPLSNPRPLGQMMLTAWPCARSASASCHTRRSNGQGRFSTMMRTRHLPGDAVIAFHGRGTLVFGRVPHPDEVDHAFPWRQAAQQLGKLSARGSDHQHVGVLEQLLRLVHHEPPDMRDVIENVFAIGSQQTCQPDVLVIDEKLITLADELLRERDDRTLAQVVRALLEAQAEQPHASPTRCPDHR